jgi:DNA (cytosine-5)-methyltransferase 1
MSTKSIPIIDLFAGPGGLGEGFTSVVNKKNERLFKIALSIEKDQFAHKTLTLRSFLRQFPFKQLPNEYYDFLKSANRNTEELFEQYPMQFEKAKSEAWKIELGDHGKHTLIDSRIKEALKGNRNFILIGGPPCQAYSLVGRARRQEGGGLNKEDVRVYLYREYYRILGVHKPPVFIMENVKGILSSKVDNISIFRQLINDLRNPVESYRKLRGKEVIDKVPTKYRIYSLVKKPASYDLLNGDPIFEPNDYIIHAEEYGIPQTRHRVILLGIRDDLNIVPEILLKAESSVTVNDVINGLPKIRSGISKSNDEKFNWKKTIEEILNTKIQNQVDSDVWELIKKVMKGITVPQKDKGADFLEYEPSVNYNEAWYLDDKLHGVCNHESRSHIKEDLFRYLFISCFAKVKGRSPKLPEFPTILLPKHANVKEAIEHNKFADRFRVQLANEPSKTITSHISKDGHYYVHPDPSQCRSLTVREAARIQTFPDNYYFCGPRTEQFHQVGNAVPPLLAYQIARIVSKLF